ncbi:PH domain-containing protein [Ferrimicrobium sp.]|uniref:PH domain-containing protein n=1 Tax=Ferrimicrobium sp. TaxID=2926050 RepID=UPI00262A976A|nr:PH domain-containing protein [Ferrimicrobium sp.]
MTEHEPMTPSLGQLSGRTQRIIGSMVDPDERVVAVIHPHWWLVLGPAATFVAASIIAILLTTFNYALLSLVGLLVLGVAVINMLVRGLQWYFEVLVITDRRVRFSRGVLLRKTSEIPLRHVNDITTQQGIIGRILHFGRLHIDSGDAFGDELITFVPNPTRLRQLLASLEDAEHPGPSVGGASAVGTNTDSLSRLERLAILRAGGFLNDAQFEQAKLSLLRDLDGEQGRRP